MSNEIELKFAINSNDIANLQYFLNQWVDCDEAEFSVISASKRTFTKLTLTNTYYDTPDYYLCNNGCALRVRGSEDKQHKQFEITLKRDSKSIGGLHERVEYNVDFPNAKLDLLALPRQALPAGCNIAQLQQNITPLFTTNFKRQTWLIEFANSEIEVALDQGEIISQEKSKIIQEVELEIKQGNKQDLLNFAIELSRFHLHLFSQSKAARGYQLLKNQTITCCEFEITNQQDLPEILKYWQQNEEYALEKDDLNFYKQTLNQVNQALIRKKLAIEPEFEQWQKALLSINSIAEFAYSEINSKLKLMLIAQVNR